MPRLAAAALAERDCRTCNRRRIRCDRRVPHCYKCSKRGLECPGYKQALRWTNAIAVRGRHRGLTAPDTVESVATQPPVTPPIHLPLLAASEISPGQENVTLKRFTEPVIKRLLEYYGTHMAPIMTWIDYPHNGYRRFILPLATSQPILRLAILASAAAHAPFDTGVDEELLNSASETVVMMITRRLTQLNEENANDASHAHVDPTDILAIIAAVLVLSDFSLLRSNLSVAQFHREGIRTILNTPMCATRWGTDVFVFLQDEVAAYDVLACTTLFQLDRIRDAILPSTGDGIFRDFLRLIHAITIHSVRQTGGEDNLSDENDASPDCPFSMMGLESAFEAARGVTLRTGASLLESGSATLKHDFIFLVAAHHHAGLLYAHKRESYVDMEQSTLCYHLGRLLEALDRIEDVRAVLGGLTWPMFIAGICCRDAAAYMHKVDSWLQLLTSYTRYEHYDLLRNFLRDLHDSPHHDWILLAKQYESRGQPVIPI